MVGTDNCHTDATCANIPGSFTCTCIPGFSGNGIFCFAASFGTTVPADFNECSDPILNNCHANATCSNTIGSFTCSCDVGFNGTGINCIDIDECTLGTDNCHTDATCANIPGSFTCTCNPGFPGDGIFCSAVNNQCFDSSSCSPNAICIFTDGISFCSCEAGFVGDPLELEFCIDIDECDQDPEVCGNNAACSNTIGSYNCICEPGYIGDGFTCFPTTLPTEPCSKSQIQNYTFSATNPGLVAYSEETCAGTSTPKASIRCINIEEEEASQFNPNSLILVNCSINIQGAINAANNNLTNPQVTTSLNDLEILTRNIGEISSADVQNITEFFVVLERSQLQYEEGNIESVVEISSHVSEFFRNSDTIEDESVNRQRQSLVQSISRISRRTASLTGTLRILSREINLEVNACYCHEVSDVSDLTRRASYSPVFYNESGSTLQPIQITLPQEALEIANGQISPSSNAVRAVFVTHRDSSLFPSPERAEWVVSSELGDDNSAIGRIQLSEYVEISHSQQTELPSLEPIDRFQTNLIDLHCVFWDFEAETWSREGCLLVPEVPPRCVCNHLTNFAILVSRTEIASNFGLDVISYVGCGLSAIGLLFTAIALLSIEKFRNAIPKQVTIHICFCLALAFLLFIFGIEGRDSRGSCAAIAAVLQYSLLCAWCWMAVYSHLIYRNLVKVLEYHGKDYPMVRAIIFAYGVPLIIVVLNVGITLGHIDMNRPRNTLDGKDIFYVSSYSAHNFCWLRDKSLYFGFLLPVGILLIFNLIMFSLVTREITCKKEQLQSSASPKSAKHHLKIAVIMATMMGLTWIIGYFMLISDNATFLTAMSWVFAVVNAFQGVLFFAFICLRDGDFRKLFLAQLFKKEDRRKSLATISTTLPSSPGPDSGRKNTIA